MIRNHGLSKADVEWRMFVRRVTEQLGITKRVHIWISELVTSPVTIGYLKPVILIPMAAVNNLSANQMEAVLLHELAHIRRYDYFVNLILKFIQSILYFNPFVKSFISIVEREREKSCDEMVIQFQYDPHGYASALLALEKTNHLHKSLAVAASGRKNDLLHRIECIMGIRNKSVVSFNKLAGLMAGLLCIIGLNAVVILSKPTSSEHAVGSSFANISSPLYFFTDDFSPSTIIDAVAEMSSEETPATIITEPKAESPSKPAVKPKAKPVKPKIDMEAMAEKINYFTANPYAAAVAYIDQPEIPVLTEAEIKQVKGAVAASKKVITEGTWKQVENNIAEVLTQQQKKILETEYKKEMNKMDWKKLEKKLSMAYDKIDWDKINIELANAVNNIRLDSLNKVYSTALANLTLVEKELNNLNVTCIPDTDISLKTLDDKKKVVVQALHQLKTAKVKKVIHL